MSTQPTEHERKIKWFMFYVKHSWPIFPCGPDKSPLTTHGHKDASLDIEQIKAWNDQFPDANWGMPTGEKTKICVIDIDKLGGKHKADGLATWEQLREEHSDPIQTVSVRSGGGGLQLWFKYPEGHKVRTGANILGPGVDIPINYVIVPGVSKTDAPYTFELSPADTEMQDLPAWILARVNGSKPIQQPETPEEISNKKNLAALINASKALNALKPGRAEDYQNWLHVGMSLYELGDDGLIMWDTWSKQAPDKYAPGTCAQKWKTFNKELTAANQITLGSLYHWAKEDGGEKYIKTAKKGASPAEYAQAMEDLGFTFTLNDMNDLVYVNGQPISDILSAVIEYQLRSKNYRSEKDTKITIYKTAYDKKFHPIRDYIDGLILDGSQDHIKNLASFFQDRDGIFESVLRKWLIGAVGRIMGDRPGQQHPMMVLDGPQGIGKSRFVWWLGSPLPAFYIQSSINTEDKDFLINLCSRFIWEVEELGATLRKSDIESLKAFLSKEIVNVRKPYGHDAITKPATASFIGTINNSGGFLADPTGSRRFRVCTLTHVDWGYEGAVDINQIWAQARELYAAGERWTLGADEEKKMREINSRYDVDDPIQFDIIDTFNVNPLETDKYTATAQIIHKLRTTGKIVGGNDNQIAQRISNVLTRIGCERSQRRINGQSARLWVGVWER